MVATLPWRSRSPAEDDGGDGDGDGDGDGEKKDPSFVVPDHQRVPQGSERTSTSSDTCPDGCNLSLLLNHNPAHSSNNHQ